MPSTPSATKEWSNVTAEILQEEIIPLYKPAILKNVVSDWEVIKKATVSARELMAYRDPNQKQYPAIDIFVGQSDINGRYAYGDNVNSRNFKRFQSNLEGILDHIENFEARNRVSAYAGAVDIKTQLPNFEAQNPLPILPPNLDAVPRAWIGTPAQISNHFDVSDNIACLVSGKRTFTLFPPEQIPNMYVAPIDNTLAGPPASMVNINNPDLSAHPRYEEALKTCEVAELEPGDALYIPSLWWHSVKSSGSFCMLVNYWWNNPEFRKDNTMMALIHDIFSISHLPLAERKAWKSLFEYYVFQTEEVALSHLPDDLRGVHGSMTAQIYNRVYEYMKQNMK